MANFYLEGRAENTIKNYGGAFRIVWSHAKEIGRFVFDWAHGEIGKRRKRREHDEESIGSY